MLRQLFLSLLILSAIVSEGIVPISQDICNFYLTEIKRLDLYNENEKDIQEAAYSLKLNGTKPGMFMSASPADSLFVLSRNTLSFLRSFNKPEEDKLIYFNSCILIDRYKPDRINVNPCVNRINRISAACRENIQLVLKKSDTSPPLRWV